MIKLLVDLGNTRLKWATWQDGRMSASKAIVHRAKDLSSLLSQAWADIPVPAQVHLASVVQDEKLQAFEQWIDERWACELIRHVSSASQLGVHNAYTKPERLGVDRWLALLGAWQHGKRPSCVVDCGSAVTIDILDGKGNHRGGWIVPGLNLMRQALEQGTALDMTAGDASAGLGQDTETAIRNGTAQAVVGLIEQALGCIAPQPRLLLTGGDAATVAKLLNRDYEIYPDLVLEGLAAVLKGA